MYTTCPECDTTFRLGVEDLRRAQGRVRCGECEHVFNAVAYLRDDAEVEGGEPPELSDTVKDRMLDLDSMPVNEEFGHDIDDPEDELENSMSGILVVEEDFDISEAEANASEDEEPDENDGQDVVRDDSLKAANDDEAADYWPEISEEEQDAAGILVTDDGEYDVSEAEAATEVEQQHEADILAATETETEAGEPEVRFGDTGTFDVSEAELLADDDADDAADDDDPAEDDGTPLSLQTHYDPAGEAGADEGLDISATEALADEEEDELDDSIWERIPGVGAATTEFGTTARATTDDDSDEPDDSDAGEAAEATDDADDDPAETSAASRRAEPWLSGIDDDADPEATAQDMEFNVPKDKWSNFFDPAPAAPRKPDWNPLAGGSSADDEAADENEPAEVDEQDTADDEVQAADAEPEDTWEAIETGSWDTGIDLADEDDDEDEDAGTETDDEAEPEYVEAVSDEHDEYATSPPWQPEELADDEAGDRSSRTGLWLVLGILLVAGFAGQLLHYNRDALAAHPEYGMQVRGFYAFLGAELYPEWSTADYEIRGSEAVAGESGADVLDIRTRIASVAATPSGLPHLRVVLRDRWSNPVAARHFRPDEYMDAAELPADGMLQPNQTVSAHVSIVDPGADAQGFELELCLPRRGTGLECTGQPFK